LWDNVEKTLYNGTGHRWQYGACEFHAEYFRLQTHTQYMYYLLIFHCNSGCRNAPQCYVTRTLPAYLVSCHLSLSALKAEAVNCSVTSVTLLEPQISEPKVVFVTNSLYRVDCCLFRCQRSLLRIWWSVIFSFIWPFVSQARGSDSVTREIMLQVGRLVRTCSIPQRDRDFPTLQIDLIGDLAHQASCQAVKGGLFPELKSPGLEYVYISICC